MSKIRIVTVIATTLLFFLFVLKPVVFGECGNGLNFCGTWTYNNNTQTWECYGQAGTGVPCQPFGNVCRWATDLGCSSINGGCDTGVCSGTPDPTSTPAPSSTPAPTTPPGSPTSTPGPTNIPPTPVPTTPAAAACTGTCLKGNIYDPEDIWHGGTYGNSQCNGAYMAGHFQYWPGGDAGSQGGAGDDNCAEQNNCPPNSFNCRDVCCGPMWPAPTPVTLTASPLCTNTNSTWTWSGGAGNYYIQRQSSAGASAWNWQSTVSGNTFTSGFTSGTATGNYGIRVSSYISVPSWSSWVNIGRDATSPSTPVGLNLVCNTNGSVSASWSPAADVGCGGLHSYPYWARLSTVYGKVRSWDSFDQQGERS